MLDSERHLYRLARRGPWGEAMIRVAHVATIDLTHRFMLLPQLRGSATRGSTSRRSVRRG